MMQQPNQSLPKQCEQWKDLKAAYRLLSNGRIEPRAIGEPHQRRTRTLCADHPVVLCVQDDTHLGGRCDREQHTTLAVLPGGRLLGVLDQRFFKRVEVRDGETRKEREARWRESTAWSDAVRAVGSAPDGCRFIHIADRAADDLNLMDCCDEHGVGFVIRARHDRRINERHGKLMAELHAQTPCGVMTVQIGEQRDRAGRITRRQRQVTAAVRFAEVELSAPWNHPGDHAPRHVWAVLLHEDDPPADGEPINWMLLTSEPIRDGEEAKRIVKMYENRWVIEEWHRALKEGCRLESAQLDQPDDHLRLAAMLSVIAVRLLQLRDLADPDHPDAQHPEALETWAPPIWIAIVASFAKCKPADLTPATFFLTIAKRGGYLNRKSDPRPGWKVLWRGWYDISLIVQGAELTNKTPFPTRCG